MLRSVTNHGFVLTKMFKSYIRLRYTIFPYYLAVVANLPPKILVITSFIDKKIEAIISIKSLIHPIYSRPLPILAHNARHMLERQQPQPLEPHESVKHSVRISVPKKTTIAPMTQRIVLLTTNIDGLMSLQNHQRIHEQHQCLLANGIAEIEHVQPFHLCIANFSVTQADT